MIIEIMSKESVREYSSSQHSETAAVISISNHDAAALRLYGNADNGVNAQLNVHFNDVEFGMANCITDAEADEIAAFVNTIAVKMDKLIIQCTYGASRSPVVAAAIMQATAGNDWRIWSNPRYRPNITCYRAVMKALHVNIDEQKLSEKVTANRNLFEIDLPLV